jgi:hypothetical protein
MKNIKPATPKGPNTTPAVTNKSRNRKITRIHFAHIWGHCSESGSRFETDTVITVAKKIKGAITTTAEFSKVPIRTIVRATTGDVTRAIAGSLNPR